MLNLDFFSLSVKSVRLKDNNINTSTDTTTQPEASPPPKESVLKVASFRWLWLSGLITMLGDQFTIIALPWLALQFSGNAVDLGGVLTMVALPRAIFILFGGALVDSYNPKKVLLLSKFATSALLFLLIHAIWAQWLTLPVLYGVAFGMGIVSALAIPAGQSYVPLVLKPELYSAGNSIQMVTRQIAIFVGPVIAGIVIAVTSGNSTESFSDNKDFNLLTGTAIAFSINAICYLLTTLIIGFKIKLQALPEKKSQKFSQVFANIGHGIKYVFADKPLASLMFYSMLTSIFMSGTIQVVLPMIANDNVNYGSQLLGWMLGAYGFGSMFGLILAGTKPKLKLVSLGLTIVILDIVIGVFLLLFAKFYAILSMALGGLSLIGFCYGILQVKTFTWVQSRTEKEFLGRTLSILAFITIGLATMSPVLAGTVIEYAGIENLLTLVGLGIVVTSGIGMLAFNMIALDATAKPIPPGDSGK